MSVNISSHKNLTLNKKNYALVKSKYPPDGTVTVIPAVEYCTAVVVGETVGAAPPGPPGELAGPAFPPAPPGKYTPSIVVLEPGLPGLPGLPGEVGFVEPGFV